MQVKNPITYREQVQMLKQKGLVIPDERRCERFLEHVNYYRFASYLYPFRTGEGRHIPGISFERIYRVYEFDRKLRSLLLTIMEEIELFLRSRISYYHAHAYGPLAYLDASYYNKGHRHKQFLRLVENVISDNEESNIVQHHRKKYDGYFPLWVVIEFFSVGMLSYFYIDLKEEDKKALARQLYHTYPPYLDSWLLCLTDLRNQCAHYSRLYDWDFEHQPMLPADLDFPGTSKVFGQILALKCLYFQPEEWEEQFFPKLRNLVEEYQDDISFAHLGFPENWISYLSGPDSWQHYYNKP